ncbi:hypothetical protein [Duganella sp. Root1480D1]|uniref:hypothetical protein n=1 Tax=Duganella sp. Root1480D1 TaxID=1736471 RepID=UPI00070BD5C7|nr:hypothetical protein [Duganella sp. Root1480D1]KQZ44091.1 hypothetical protein ASD58_20385 [Duganella sp. Root1480D1]
MSAATRGARQLALPAAVLVAAALLLRGSLEASMALHMALQLPMIAIGGALAGLAAARSAPRLALAIARWDAHGLAGLVWLLLSSAYWMVPRALEQSLTMALAEAGKFASLFLLGFLLPGALARAAAVIQLFFLGNFCAMMAITGMLYQDMPQRLCNAYSLDDQVVTGVGLVVASIGIAAAWCVWQLPALAGQIAAAGGDGTR